MARICELTGKRPMKGSIIWRSGKSKKSGGIGTHVTAITKRRFIPNLQRVKALIEWRSALRPCHGQPPSKRASSPKRRKRTWKKGIRRRPKPDPAPRTQNRLVSSLRVVTDFRLSQGGWVDLARPAFLLGDGDEASLHFQPGHFRKDFHPSFRAAALRSPVFNPGSMRSAMTSLTRKNS